MTSEKEPMVGASELCEFLCFTNSDVGAFIARCMDALAFIGAPAYSIGVCYPNEISFTTYGGSVEDAVGGIAEYAEMTAQSAARSILRRAIQHAQGQ